MKLAKKITLVAVALALVVCSVSLGTLATDVGGQTVDGIMESVQKYVDSEVLYANDGTAKTGVTVSKASLSLVENDGESYLSAKGQTTTTARAASVAYSVSGQMAKALSLSFRFSIDTAEKTLEVTAGTDVKDVMLLSLTGGSPLTIGTEQSAFNANVNTWYDIAVIGSTANGFHVTVSEEGTENAFSGDVAAPAGTKAISGYSVYAGIWKATAKLDDILTVTGDKLYTMNERFAAVTNAVISLDAMYEGADEETRASIISAIKTIDGACKLAAPADAETNTTWQAYCAALAANTKHDSLASLIEFREAYAAYLLLTTYSSRAEAIAQLDGILTAVDACNASLITDGYTNGLADLMDPDDYSAYLGEREGFLAAKNALAALKVDCDAFIALLDGYDAASFSTIPYAELRALCAALDEKTIDETYEGIPAAKDLYDAAEVALNVRFAESLGGIIAKLTSKEYYVNDGSSTANFKKTKAPKIATEDRSGNNVIVLTGNSTLQSYRTEAFDLPITVGSNGDLFVSISMSGTGLPTLYLNAEKTLLLDVVPDDSISFFNTAVSGFKPSSETMYTYDIVFYAAEQKATLSVNGELLATKTGVSPAVDSLTLHVGTWKKLTTVIDEIYIADGTGRIDPKEISAAVCEEILSYNNYYTGIYADANGKKAVIETIDEIAKLFDINAGEPEAASPEHEKWVAAKEVFDLNATRKQQVFAELFRNGYAAFASADHAGKKALVADLDLFLTAFATADETVLGEAYVATREAASGYETARAEFVRIDGICTAFTSIFDGITLEALETKTYSELLAIREAADKAFSNEIDDTADGVPAAKEMYQAVRDSVIAKYDQYVRYIRGTAVTYGIETNSFEGNLAILAEIDAILADQFTVGDDVALADVKVILEANEGRKISLYIESFLYYLNFYESYTDYTDKENVLADLKTCLEKYDLMEESAILAVLPNFDAANFAAKRVIYNGYVDALNAAREQAENFIAQVGEETLESVVTKTYDAMVELSGKIAVYADGLDATYPGAADAKAVYDALNGEIASRYAAYTGILGGFAEGYLTGSYAERLATLKAIAALIADNFSADCLKAEDKAACEGAYALYDERVITVHLDSFKDGIAVIQAGTLKDYTAMVALRSDLAACVEEIDAIAYDTLLALRPEYAKETYENDRDVVFAGFKSDLGLIKSNADAFIEAFKDQTEAKLNATSYSALLTAYNAASPLRDIVDASYVDETDAKKMTAAEAIELYGVLLSAIENKYAAYRDAVASVSAYDNVDLTYDERVAMIKLVAGILDDSFVLRDADAGLQSILDVNEERSVSVHTSILYDTVAAWKEETDYSAKLILNMNCNTYLAALDGVDEAIVSAHADGVLLAAARQDVTDLAAALVAAKQNADALIDALANLSESSASKLDYLTAKDYADNNREKYDIIDRTYIEGKKSGEVAARIFEAILARIEEITDGSHTFEANVSVMTDIGRSFLDRYNAYVDALAYLNTLDAGYGNNAELAVIFAENRAGIEQTVSDCKEYISYVERANYATDFETKREMLAKAATYQVKADYPGVADAMALYSALLGNIDSSEEAVRVFRNAVEKVSDLVSSNGDYHAIRNAVNIALKAETAAKASGIPIDDSVLVLSNARADIEIKVGYSEKYLAAVNAIHGASSLSARYEAINAALAAKGNAYASYDGVEAANDVLDAEVVKYNEDVKKANAFFNSLGKR